MTINVKLRSALALAVVALAVTSIELRSANAEHVTPVRAGRVSTAVDQVKQAGVTRLRETQVTEEEKKGRIVDDRTSRLVKERKGRN